MSYESGTWDSAGTWDGSYWDWCATCVPVEITLAQPELKSVAEGQDEQNHMPITAVELVDNDLSIAYQVGEYVENWNLSRDVKNLIDSASLKLCKAGVIGPDVPVTGLPFTTEKKSRIRIKAGYRVNGMDYLTRVWTGCVVSCPENYSQNVSEIDVTSMSMAQFLEWGEGLLEDYTGSYACAILQMLDNADLVDHHLAIEDFEITDAVTFAATTPAETLTDLMKLQPSIDWYWDEFGFGVFRRAETPSEVEFTYSEASTGNIWNTKKGRSCQGLVTDVAVAGSTVASSKMVTNATLKSAYGRRFASISSAAIDSSAKADSAANELIIKSQRPLNAPGFDMHLNPLAVMRSLVALTHMIRSRLPGSQVIVTSLSHSFEAGGRAGSTSRRTGPPHAKPGWGS